MRASTGTKLIAVFVTGIPMCLLGGIVYAWTSGKTLIDGFVNAYGALYKIPGTIPFSLAIQHYRSSAYQKAKALGLLI